MSVRKQETAAGTYVHVEDLDDYVWNETNHAFFERGQDDSSQIVEYLQDGGYYVFADRDEMFAFMRDNYEVEDVFPEHSCEGGDVGTFTVEVDAEHTLRVSRKENSAYGKYIYVQHETGGNNMLLINKDGVLLMPSYRGVAEVQHAALCDRVVRVRTEEGECDLVPGGKGGAPPKVASGGEARLRADAATAMWSDDGVRVTMRTTGVVHGATLEEALGKLPAEAAVGA